MRRQPNHQTFAQVNGNLLEHVFFGVSIEIIGRPQAKQTPIFKEGMLHAVGRNSDISVWELDVTARRSQTTVYRVLHNEALRRFQVQIVQLLLLDDHTQPIMLAQFFVNQSAAGMHVASSVLLCNKSTYSREGMFNKHSAYK